VKREEKYRRSHGLGARSQKFRAHSERIQSGYRADTDRIQSDGERRGTPGAPTGLERDLKSSERTRSGYRADTERRRTVRHWFGAKSSEVIYEMEFSTYEERLKLGFQRKETTLLRFAKQSEVGLTACNTRKPPSHALHSSKLLE